MRQKLNAYSLRGMGSLSVDKKSLAKLNWLMFRLLRMQQELDVTLQQSSAQETSLQTSLAHSQKEREHLQSELQQARSALESHASEREYMQSEASSLQQALKTQEREAQQARDVLVTQWQQQVRPFLSHTDDQPQQLCLASLALQLRGYRLKALCFVPG